MSDISIALGGGGIKGIAHIGVLRRLEKEGFTIRAVAGTSAGGIVGSIFAAGYTPDEIEAILIDMMSSHLFARQHGDGPSLLGLAGVAQSITDTLGERTFEDLKIPFACTAVDINTAQEIIFTHGQVVDAVLATVAVPGVFPPKQLGDLNLVDGGVMDPVPVSLARWLAPNLPVVAVVLAPPPSEWAKRPAFSLPAGGPIPATILQQVSRFRIAQAFSIFVRSMDITHDAMGELRLQKDKPDVIIRPDVSRFGMLDDVDPKELIALGEQAADLCLPMIRETLSWHSQISRRFRRTDPPGDRFFGAPAANRLPRTNE